MIDAIKIIKKAAGNKLHIGMAGSSDLILRPNSFQESLMSEAEMALNPADIAAEAEKRKQHQIQAVKDNVPEGEQRNKMIAELESGEAAKKFEEFARNHLKCKKAAEMSSEKFNSILAECESFAKRIKSAIQ
jgi:uncharacterized protein with von Willebrand factor type A (vWA) domain